MKHQTIRLSIKLKKNKNKNENFNTLPSREMKSITWKVKKAWENMWKTLWKG